MVLPHGVRPVAFLAHVGHGGGRKEKGFAFTFPIFLIL